MDKLQAIKYVGALSGTILFLLYIMLMIPGGFEFVLSWVAIFSIPVMFLAAAGLLSEDTWKGFTSISKLSREELKAAVS